MLGRSHGSGAAIRMTASVTVVAVVIIVVPVVAAVHGFSQYYWMSALWEEGVGCEGGGEITLTISFQIIC